jgi:N,N'-diacetyllegionaminate synthase
MRTRPELIAEIGGNHEGDFEYAQHLVALAVKTPVDSVKLQVYAGDSLVSERVDPDRNRHFKRFELSRKQYETLMNQIRDAGKRYLCSVWDKEMIDWLNPQLTAYKVGSGDLTAYPILKHIATTSKPIILSTGLATLHEVEEAVQYLRACNPVYGSATHLTLLQCTSMYPIEDRDAHLEVMRTLRKSFQCRVGYSDHTRGCGALRLAAALGADVLEFHFTDSREGKTFRDHSVSLTPDDIDRLIEDMQKDANFIGNPDKRPLPIEADAGHLRSFRRAVYPSRDISPGEELGDHNITVLRPNQGIDAREYDQLVGRVARRKLLRHESLTWDDVR